MGLYISLCGNIGAGKTSLARLIAQTWHWQHFEEQVDDHPFLADFYRDRARWALASQLVFLERSFRQQYDITRQSLDAVQEHRAKQPIRRTWKARFIEFASVASVLTSNKMQEQNAG